MVTQVLHRDEIGHAKMCQETNKTRSITCCDFCHSTLVLFRIKFYYYYCLRTTSFCSLPLCNSDPGSHPHHQHHQHYPTPPLEVSLHFFLERRLWAFCSLSESHRKVRIRSSTRYLHVCHACYYFKEKVLGRSTSQRRQFYSCVVIRIIHTYSIFSIVICIF